MEKTFSNASHTFLFDLGMRVNFNKNTYVQMIDARQFKQENETDRKLHITMQHHNLLPKSTIFTLWYDCIY